MTALSLASIAAAELARIDAQPAEAIRGRPRRTVFDPTLPGFGTRHYASGRASYIVQRRMGGRMRTVTLGSAALLTVTVARDVAARILLRCQVEENPAEERRRVRAVPTWPDFLDEYWRRLAPQWKPRTCASHDSYRRNHLDQAFRGRHVDQIDQGDVARWFAALTDRAGPGGANRCLEILGAAMRKAELWGYRPAGTNPVTGLRRNRKRVLKRFLSREELVRLGDALREAEVTRPAQADAVRLILLTGCRKSEITALRWSEVKGRRLLLTNSKTGARTVWLGDAARGIIDRQPRSPRGEHVFAFGHDPARYRLDGFWNPLRRIARLPGVRLHDLRHTFASHAALREETLPMIGRLLGHASIASTARYAHLTEGAVLSASEQIGLRIQGMTGDVEDSSLASIAAA